MTVSEVISSLHKDLMHKLSDNSPFIVYKCFLEDEFYSSKECVSLPNLSNVGRFNSEDKFSGEIRDTWIQQIDHSKFAEGECFMLAFSKDKHGQNTLVTRLQQSSSVMDQQDSKTLFQSIMHVMKEVPVGVTVQEAYNELQSFQKTIKKE